MTDHALVDILQALKLDVGRSRSSSSSKKKQDKKKKRRGRSSSQSSSSLQEGQSQEQQKRKRSSSSNGSRSRSKSPVKWKHDGKSKDISVSKRGLLDEHKLQNRTALLAFAMRHPGALTAHFLNVVHLRLSKGIPSNTRDLAKVSVAQWAEKYTELTELRDLREVQTLAECFDRLNRGEVEACADIIVQRIQAIRVAKKKGGTWEKAESLELITSGGSGGSLLPAGMVGLT